ncbi:MAG: TetR/AcrR family transcriptional regulator, partial [Actinobacteria bacterium]|nr:TetR/AcrR family transcriptional regulator [Actinomycetota bacterium]
MPASTGERASARERLLASASELFYGEGIHTVGIDRIIEHAGVAKASLYSTFGSKDELIRAYLEERHATRRERILARVETYDSPRARLLGVFDYLATSIADPAYHGCAFINASAEATPRGPVEDVVTEFRGWMRNLFTDLARTAGASNPKKLARQLQMLYDGANVSARLDRDTTAAATAKAAAAALLD